MKLLQSIAAGLLLAASLTARAESAGETADGSCEHPAEADATDTSAVSMPDYVAEGDVAADASDVDANSDRADAMARNLDYHRTMATRLAASPDPHDWALATVVMSLEAGLEEIVLRRNRTSPKPSDTLLGRALDSLPNDPLVLWVAVERGERGGIQRRDQALLRLQELEPDNAAVWMEVLAAAASRHDEAAIGLALARMAMSREYNSHFADQMKAVAGVYLRFPPPAELLVAGETAATKPSAETVVAAQALAMTTATAMPSFQHLVNACRVDPASGRNRDRVADCATVGRLLAAHGDSLVAARIGPAVLRVSQTYTADDQREARDFDWIYSQYLAALPTEESPQAAERFARHFDDWIASGSEIEAMRRTVARAGLATSPPDDWVDRYSQFSEERQRSNDRAGNGPPETLGAR